MSSKKKNFKIVKSLYEKDKFAQKMGFELLDLTEKTIKMKTTLRKDMENLYGKPHGAALFGFADAAFSILVNNQNNISVALDCSISYHNAADTGVTLYLDGKKLSTSRKICVCLIEIYKKKDSENVPIVTMKGTAYRTGRPIQK